MGDPGTRRGEQSDLFLVDDDAVRSDQIGTEQIVLEIGRASCRERV